MRLSSWLVRRTPIAIFTAAAVLSAATALAAHDFWLIPDAFTIAGDSTARVSGHSGTRFGTSQSPTQPSRIMDARIIGAGGEQKITDLSVVGTSLRLAQRPGAAGQYLVTIALQPRVSRTTPQGLLRYLRAEGAAGESARLERSNELGGDSLGYRSLKYATTIVQVGRGGSRAFAKSTGHPLQLVPLADPGDLHVGDTLRVRVTMHGEPLRNTAVHAGPAVDTTVRDSTGRPQDTTIHLSTDAAGVLHLPITKAGPWNMRTAAVVPSRDASVAAWDVAWATFVFPVGARH